MLARTTLGSSLSAEELQGAVADLAVDCSRSPDQVLQVRGGGEEEGVGRRVGKGTTAVGWEDY